MVDGSIVTGPVSPEVLDQQNADIVTQQIRANNEGREMTDLGLAEVESTNAAQGEGMMQIFSPDNVGTILMLAQGTGGLRQPKGFNPKFGETLARLTKRETLIANRASKILENKDFKAGIEGMKSGTNSETTINGVKVVFQSDGPFSGFTLFGEQGFVIGKEALKSSTEISKTVLHETFRISTSAAKSGGSVSQKLLTKETNAAATFADRAFKALNN